MPKGKVFFFEKKKMLENFQRIIRDDPPMDKLTDFHDFLTQFAGKQTYLDHVCLILATAFLFADGFRVNFGKYLAAMVDDVQTVEEAKKVLNNTTIIVVMKR